MTTTPSRRPVQLNQIVAIEGGLRTRTEKAATDAYRLLSKPAALTGIAKTYRPRDTEGEQLPSESTEVQVRVPQVLDAWSSAMARMYDVVLTKDTANCRARADVVVGTQTILSDVPVSTLIWLEKKLGDVRKFLAELPVLDVAEKWDWDEPTDTWATPVSETTRTKKVPRNHVLAPATEKHAAQVNMWMEDIVVGYWRTVKYSGALPATRKALLLQRVEKLIDAVRFAREAANTLVVEDREAGDQIFSYLLA